jgi:hypothetical protein
MIRFTAIIKRFDEKGEKTGWTYIEVPAATAELIKPGNKKSFTIKGKLDEYSFEGLSLLPMGEGNFILALKADVRKAIKKQKGAAVTVQMEEDKLGYQLNAELLECLADEPLADKAFSALPASHKNYYSKWVDSAKAENTRAKRIAMVINAMLEGLDFAGMLRKEREERKLLGR